MGGKVSGKKQSSSLLLLLPTLLQKCHSIGFNTEELQSNSIFSDVFIFVQLFVTF